MTDDEARRIAQRAAERLERVALNEGNPIAVDMMKREAQAIRALLSAAAPSRVQREVRFMKEGHERIITIELEAGSTIHKRDGELYADGEVLPEGEIGALTWRIWPRV